MMVIYAGKQICLCDIFYVWFYLCLCLAYNVSNNTRVGILAVPMCMHSTNSLFERIFYKIQVIMNAIHLIHLLIGLLTIMSCFNLEISQDVIELGNLKFKLLGFLLLLFIN